MTPPLSRWYVLGCFSFAALWCALGVAFLTDVPAGPPLLGAAVALGMALEAGRRNLRARWPALIVLAGLVPVAHATLQPDMMWAATVMLGPLAVVPVLSMAGAVVAAAISALVPVTAVGLPRAQRVR